MICFISFLQRTIVVLGCSSRVKGRKGGRSLGTKQQGAIHIISPDNFAVMRNFILGFDKRIM